MPFTQGYGPEGAKKGPKQLYLHFLNTIIKLIRSRFRVISN